MRYQFLAEGIPARTRSKKIVEVVTRSELIVVNSSTIAVLLSRFPRPAVSSATVAGGDRGTRTLNVTAVRGVFLDVFYFLHDLIKDQEGGVTADATTVYPKALLVKSERANALQRHERRTETKHEFPCPWTLYVLI